MAAQRAGTSSRRSTGRGSTGWLGSGRASRRPGPGGRPRPASSDCRAGVFGVEKVTTDYPARRRLPGCRGPRLDAGRLTGQFDDNSAELSRRAGKNFRRGDAGAVEAMPGREKQRKLAMNTAPSLRSWPLFGQLRKDPLGLGRAAQVARSPGQRDRTDGNEHCAFDADGSPAPARHERQRPPGPGVAAALPMTSSRPPPRPVTRCGES